MRAQASDAQPVLCKKGGFFYIGVTVIDGDVIFARELLWQKCTGGLFMGVAPLKM